ncbi:MAG: ABC transporter ATP-binding protein, partial [Candidatus Limnocylindrales bacterium]
AGRVTVAGQDLGALGEDGLARFRRDRVGIVFQSFHLVPTMTALENVAIPLELGGRRDAFAEAQAALGRVGLGHRTGHYPGELSGGEQQRVAIARAITGRPAIVLADEPTGNLDSAAGAAILELLLDLNRTDGATIAVITHDRDLASALPRQVWIRDGRIEGDTAGVAG